MPRYSIINPATLTGMTVVKVPDQEVILSDRMAQFVMRWAESDPPMAAQYDVGGLEFDPNKIIQEVGTSMQLNVLSRVNQAAKAVTLAFAVGSDLDAIASRYPGGVPRVSSEIYGSDDSVLDMMAKDARYRERIWLAPNLMTGAGTAEGYRFVTLTALPNARDVTATVQRTPTQVTAVISIMMEGPDPIPTRADILKAVKALSQDDVQPLTDAINVQAVAPKDVAYDVAVWLYPWAEPQKDQIIADMKAALDAFLESRRWQGDDHSRLDMDAALARTGVHHVSIGGMAGDVNSAGPNQFLRVLSATVRFAGVTE